MDGDLRKIIGAMKSILVTGANGQLGNKMREAVAAGTQNRYIFTDVAELDITDLAAVERMVEAEKIDVIINCAAYTNVDKAEDDEAMAMLINCDAVRNLAVAAQKRGAVLIHVSTDYVFQGEGFVPCVETMPTSPLGVYGVTKLKGEEAIVEAGAEHIIIRTAWLYSEYGGNFVKTIKRLAAERDSLKVVFDQVGTPTYAGDLAAAIFDIVEEGKYLDVKSNGVYHYSNEGVCSWYDFARAIVEMSGESCEVLPCHSDEFPSKVKRPHFSVLDKSKIKETFGTNVPYWRDSLSLCIDNLK